MKIPIVVIQKVLLAHWNTTKYKKEIKKVLDRIFTIDNYVEVRLRFFKILYNKIKII